MPESYENRLSEGQSEGLGGVNSQRVAPIFGTLSIPKSVLWPVEWVVIFMGVITYLLYRLLDLPMPGQPGQAGHQGPALFYLKQLLTSLDLYALVLLMILLHLIVINLHAVRWRFAKLNWGELFKHYSRRLWLNEVLIDFRLFNAVLIMFVEFSLLKNLIPHINSNVWDQMMVNWDAIFCGSLPCAQHLHEYLGPDVADFVSRTYIWYFPFMTLALFTMIAQHNRGLGKEYVMAFVSMFFIGIFWVYLLPTWGPVYFTPAAFEFLRETDVGALQQDLWNMKLHLESSPKSTGAIFMISGFPSLHVAVTLLSTIYLWKVSRVLGIVSLVFMLLTINSTIYLGWHYLVDDIAAVFLVLLSILIARRLTNLGYHRFLVAYEPRTTQQTQHYSD